MATFAELFKKGIDYAKNEDTFQGKEEFQSHWIG